MPERYIGLMSGTSLDGVDAALVEYAADGSFRFVEACYLPYSAALRTRFLALHADAGNSLREAQLLAVEVAHIYAESIKQLLAISKLRSQDITAIGCHGQTVMHDPAAGFSLQINQPALLAELSEITVVADFRNRDIAAGGQGAPLVPAFHEAVFRVAHEHRVVLNLGGIANITDLPRSGTIRGFDTGPGNMLLDAWIEQQLGQRFDADGQFARQGKAIPTLLARLMTHEFLAQHPPKSCGREQFNLAWLQSMLQGNEKAEDVQATLAAYTVQTVAEAIQRECGKPDRLLVCGGGARNPVLMEGLQNIFPHTETTQQQAYPGDWVEAIAFAWLAQRTLHGQPGNLAEVTGARGPRVLGAIYPR